MKKGWKLDFITPAVTLPPGPYQRKTNVIVFGPLASDGAVTDQLGTLAGFCKPHVLGVIFDLNLYWDTSCFFPAVTAC